MNDTTREDTVETEDLLEQFRQWIDATRAEAGAIDLADRAGALEAAGDGREFGLVALAEEFTALRHELKLQTKSGRGLVDQSETMVAALQNAIDHFRSVAPREEHAAWTRGKPLAEALADLDEALERSLRAIETARRRISEEAVEELAHALEERYRGQSWLRRRLTAAHHRQALELVRNVGPPRRAFFDAMREGQILVQNRLRRAMKDEAIAHIVCEGRPVDPERMIVIEAVEGTGRPPGTVVEELRRGYAWRGRLLRAAEVRAAGIMVSNGPGLDIDDDLDRGQDDVDGQDREGDRGNGPDSAEHGTNARHSGREQGPAPGEPHEGTSHGSE